MRALVLADPHQIPQRTLRPTRACVVTAMPLSGDGGPLHPDLLPATVYITRCTPMGPCCVAHAILDHLEPIDAAAGAQLAILADWADHYPEPNLPCPGCYGACGGTGELPVPDLAPGTMMLWDWRTVCT